VFKLPSLCPVTTIPVISINNLFRSSKKSSLIYSPDIAKDFILSIKSSHTVLIVGMKFTEKLGN